MKMKNENNRCITLPYVGNASLVFKKSLITQFERIDYHCNVNFILFNVSNYFSLKDVTPLALRANVVYCLKGSCDKSQSYIGKTEGHLAMRIQEHPSGKSRKYAIHEHITSCMDCHSFSISYFYILAHAYTYFEAKVKETLYIKDIHQH